MATEFYRCHLEQVSHLYYLIKMYFPLLVSERCQDFPVILNLSMFLLITAHFPVNKCIYVLVGTYMIKIIF